MRRWICFGVVTLVATCGALLSTWAGESARSSRPEASATAASATAQSVTIFPIVLNSGQPSDGVAPEMPKKLAELVGLMLERGGVKEIEIAETRFTPAGEADLGKLAEAFGSFVRSQNLQTEYALFGQFIGTPAEGVEEIRLVAADREGRVVLSERRNRRQLAQPAQEKVGPMIAGYQLVRRLQGVWGLADPNRKDAPEGKMARRWAEKSGLPPKEELEAIESRRDHLKKQAEKSTVAVYPVRVAGKGDEQAAAELAEMLDQKGFAGAEAAGTDPKLSIQPNTNQLRIAWDLARAFREFLRENPPQADYALLADYGIGRTPDGKTHVGGLQFVLCDRRGNWVVVSLRNSHHADFRRIGPRSPGDCNRLVAEAVAAELR